MTWLEDIILRLGPPEFVAILLLICCVPVLLTQQTVLRAAGASLIGMLTGLIGNHVDSDIARFTTEHLPAAGEPVVFLPLALILIPWCIRAQAENHLPFPLLGFLKLSTWRARVLVVWRFILVAAIALHLTGIVIEFGNEGVLLAAALGIFGLILNRCGIPWPALYVAFVLAPMLEENLRRSMLLARGDFLSFSERPVAVVIAVFLALAFALRRYVYRERYCRSLDYART